MKQSGRTKINFLSIAILISVLSCNSGERRSQKEKEMTENSTLKKGTFAYDLQLLKERQDVIVLAGNEGKSRVVVSPDLQGRVMTSTLDGPEGTSMGWINHQLLKSGEIQQHINAYGGEDRFWIGPEGGQFSVFFKPNTSFDFENWFTPKEIDTEPFDLVSSNDSIARFRKEMKLINYSGTEFDFLVNRNIKLLNIREIDRLLQIVIHDSISFVGVESENIITNKGEKIWTRESGMLSIWILGMLNPSPGTTIVIPFREGAELGRIVNDEYFGKVPPERLKIEREVLFFKGDGKYRSKIGLTPMRAKPVAGSYDEERKILTIVQFTLPEGENSYVNSMWEIQSDPFSGDAVNSYNDGPLEDGGQMGPFYELESSSPAANLAPGESITHYHRTIHFKGEEKELDHIAKKMLGVSIERIKAAF